jgi:hypothetical protein
VVVEGITPALPGNESRRGPIVRRDFNALSFIQLFKARVGACASIEPDHRAVSIKSGAAKKVWVIRRSAGEENEGSLFADDSQAQEPIQLVHGGQIELDIVIQEYMDRTIELVSYRIAFEGIPDNANGIGSMRFELDCIGRGGDGWDEDLLDNPEHPLSHFHMNYLAGNGANDCRLPAGPICPIVLLRSFDFWYRSCFE